MNKQVNKYAETCHWCGEMIPPGEGWGELISTSNTDEEELDFIYGGRTGWFFYHSDPTICERNKALAKAEARRIKEEEEREKAAWHSVLDSATDGMTRVEPFQYQTFKEVAARHEQWSHSKVFEGEINGVRCVVLYTYFTGDQSESVQYYCAEPQKAQLRIKKSSTLSDFFGE